MKNVKNTILAHIGGNTELGDTGWNMADALDETAGAMLDANRFEDEATAVLSRYEDCEDEALYPSADVLAAGGVDLVALNNASENGLDMRLFGQALAAGLALGDVNDLLERYEGDELSGMLANYVESCEEEETYPDPVARALIRLGEGAEVDFGCEGSPLAVSTIAGLDGNHGYRNSFWDGASMLRG